MFNLQNISINLTAEDKNVLIRAFTHYYKSYVWAIMRDKNNKLASDEDYCIRAVANKLGLKNIFPSDIQQGM